MPEPESFIALLAGLRQADPAAAERVFAEYWQRLVRLARRQLFSTLQPKIGPEDVVQSVFATVFRHLPEGKWDLKDKDGLWRLLAEITIHKCQHKNRDFRAGKRDVAVEKALPATAAGSFAGNYPLPDARATPEEAAVLVDLLQALIANATEQESRILEMRLASYEIYEIAETLGCSERTVLRKLQVFRRRLARLLSECQLP